MAYTVNLTGRLTIAKLACRGGSRLMDVRGQLSVHTHIYFLVIKNERAHLKNITSTGPHEGAPSLHGPDLPCE